MGNVGPGTLLGTLRLEKEIGRGAMGVIYAAEDTVLRRRVAVKILADDVAGDQDAIERFAREARALAQLNTPHVVRILSVGEVPTGAPYVVMELLVGQTVEAKLVDGPFSVREATRLMKQTLEALVLAHAAGVVHRDVKPSNLFLVETVGREPTVKVLDFGLAKHVHDARLTQTGDALGSPAYMSPEQIRGGAVDARSDVWSVGVTFYELLTGELPFAGASVATVLSRIVAGVPKPLGEVRKAVPPELAHVVMRCLEKNPADRYASAADLLRAITAAEPKTPTHAPPARRWPIFVASAGAVLVVAAITLGVLTSRKERPTPRDEAAVIKAPAAGPLPLPSSAPSLPVLPDRTLEPKPRAAPPARAIRVSTSHKPYRPWVDAHAGALARCVGALKHPAAMYFSWPEGGRASTWTWASTAEEHLSQEARACVYEVARRQPPPTCAPEDDDCVANALTFTP